MTPEDRLNFVADSWALVQAGRAEPPSYLALIEEIGSDDHRAVWDQVIGTLTRLDRLARDRPERPALQSYARAKLRPVFDRLGWDGSGSGDDDDALLRASLISALGEFGDDDILAEAKRRFAGFLQDPQSLPSALRDPVTHLVGVTADRASYDTLLALARKSTVTNERLRYYFAAASARDPALARATLALTLTDELPSTIVGGVINTVASSGEQPDLAWDFVQKNFDALAAKQGPSFRDAFVAELHDQFQRRGPCRRARALRAGAGDLRRPRDDGARAGNDRDRGRSQDARAAGDRRLDQGAQRRAALSNGFVACRSRRLVHALRRSRDAVERTRRGPANFQIRISPGPQRPDHGLKRASERRQRVFYARRHLRIDLAMNEAGGFELAKLPRQHALCNPR